MGKWAGRGAGSSFNVPSLPRFSAPRFPLSPDRGLWTVDCGRWTVDCALSVPTRDSRLRSDCGLRTACARVSLLCHALVSNWHTFCLHVARNRPLPSTPFDPPELPNSLIPGTLPAHLLLLLLRAWPTTALASLMLACCQTAALAEKKNKDNNATRKSMPAPHNYHSAPAALPRSFSVRGSRFKVRGSRFHPRHHPPCHRWTPIDTGGHPWSAQMRPPFLAGHLPGPFSVQGSRLKVQGSTPDTILHVTGGHPLTPVVTGGHHKCRPGQEAQNQDPGHQQPPQAPAPASGRLFPNPNLRANPFSAQKNVNIFACRSRPCNRIQKNLSARWIFFISRIHI